LPLVFRLVALLGLVAACGTASPAPAVDPLAGTYRVGGGDAAAANVQALADAFAAEHPGVKFSFDTTLGSDGGVNLTVQHVLDVGMASRELSAAENDLVDRVLVGVAGTGLVVHQSNGVRELTTAQVQQIFNGRITDWSALGAAKSVPVVPLIREKGSSARTTFENYVFGGKPAYGPGVLEIQGGDQIRQAVAGQAGAIGMVGVTGDDAAPAGTRILSIDGTMPTKTALRDGSYKLRRPLYVVVAKTGNPKAAISQFVEFIRSPEGQKILDRF
jgi:phosphate transport system substrate-binding protein